MRFFWTSTQGTAPDATGHKGFYYHFLDMTTGRRAGRCELSTVDTAFLLAGMLAAAPYFDGESEDEQAIRGLADALYRQANWPWACNGGGTEDATGRRVAARRPVRRASAGEPRSIRVL